MAPTQNTNQQNNQRRSLRSISKNTQNKTEVNKNDQKRKAENSPPKDKTLKRSAFVDLTNAIGKNVVQDIKNVTKKGVAKPATKITSRALKATTAVTNVPKPERKIVTNVPQAERKIPQPERKNIRSSSVLKPERNATNVLQPIQKTQATIKRLPTLKKPEVVLIPKKEQTKSKSPAKKEDETKEKLDKPKGLTNDSRRVSSDASLYVSALEEIPTETSEQDVEEKPEITSVEPEVPSGVDDFDKENLNDPYQVSLYAMDIFKYLKENEVMFKVSDYMGKQPSITQWMRSLLVDWMVETQENFELNHETLYLAVKLVDLYLSKTTVNKEKLQLVGAAALFVASKYDEQCPPSLDDYLYICSDAYTRNEFMGMEISVLKSVDYKLGMPLSYRFLRRYARCARLTLPMLTLARYILELSLMEYSFILESESRLAAASLFLALKMKLHTGWTETLEYYSGYTVDDIRGLALELNTMLHKEPKELLPTIRNKYSHKLFFEVAKTPLLEESAV